MKILFSGHHNPNFMTITEYMEKALLELGHELAVFEDRQHIIPGRIRYRIKQFRQLDIEYINRKMIFLSLESKPDLAIVTGGHRIKPSTVKALKNNGIATALWTIDPPRNFQPIQESASVYDYIFCQGSEAVELLNQAGVKNVQWLPVACDPDHHMPCELSDREKQYYGNDIVFVGSYYPGRAELFENLTDFDIAVWGPGWDKLEKSSRLKPFVKAAHTKPREWVKIYNACKIILAPHYQAPNNSFPVYQASPRIFEALACGAFVISNNQKDVFSIFTKGEHLESFCNIDDLRDIIKYYLHNPEERQAIARQGRDEAVNCHSYVLRMKKLLSIVS